MAKKLCVHCEVAEFARHFPGIERQAQNPGKVVFNDRDEHVGSVDDIVVTQESVRRTQSRTDTILAQSLLLD